MDTTTAQHRDRSRPSFPRSASRSSTSTSNTRVTNQTQNSGGSSSPQMSHAHPTHRFHHNGCAKPTAGSPTLTSRPTPQLSREASSESNRPSAMSSFLQEKLQKERQSELYKTAAASPTSKSGCLAASLDLGRANTSSPFKDSSTNRPQSSSGDSGSGKKGHGVKEMEQVISSLHKQNFDLKLELYHRRERQTALEDRVEGLESDKAQMEQMNDKLMEELEKRDKAVEEAVAMIVTLEAKIDQLAQERRMVQQIEAESMFRAPDFGNDYQQPGPAQDTERLHPDEDLRALTRMPSFLSDRTENTENLRNVYLHGRSSMMSLPRVSEPLEGLASPSLSILSESSFVSVYGQKGQDQIAPLEVTEPLSLDGGASKSASSTDAAQRPSTAKGRSASIPKSPSLSTRSNVNGQFHSISDVVGQSSPLQRLEKMDPSYGRRPQSSGRDISVMNSSKSNKSPARRRTREEKREALRKVITEAPGGVRLQEHALPPTPDTMSTSTLRRFRSSNDTLETEARNEAPAQPSLTERAPEARAGVPLQSDLATVPRVLDLSLNSYPHHIAAIRRPRSADETTVSQHRRGNDWDFDSDDDGQSLRSSLDIWMRQGGSKQDLDGRVSPDLFGFPTSASRGAWAMDAMFGPGSAYAGGAQIMGSAQAMDELFSAQGKPENQGPPPPGRRSSYHARTGSTSATPTMTSQTNTHEVPKQRSPQRKPPRHHKRGGSADHRTRSASAAQPTAPAQSTAEQQQQGQDKRGHYPPLSSSGGARAGLNRLFRRSLGGAVDAGIPPRSPSAPIDGRADGGSLPPPPSQVKTSIGTLSWVHRGGVVDDERSGATPPPILRNGRHQREESATVEEGELQEPSTPIAPACYPQPMEVIAPPSPAGQQQQGGRRKWLPGFGRASSLRNRTG